MIYKISFFSTLMLGSLISISSYSWFTLWLGLEINLLSFIPLLNFHKNINSSESSMKYFIIQAISSFIFITFLIFKMENFSFSNMFMNLALLTKMGASPYHFWMPEICESLSWLNNMILATWQKLTPSILLMYFFFEKMIVISIIFSIMIGSLLSFNQNKLRKILIYSSINNIGWMLILIMYNKSLWIMYFLIYSLLTINLMMIFYLTQLFFIPQLNMKLNNKFLKLMIMLLFLSLSGLPPFIGFLPKWMTINLMMNYNNLMISLYMILLTLPLIYVYMRLTLNSLIFYFPMFKINNQLNNLMISFLTSLNLMMIYMISFFNNKF
uniref:NADH-ubiquinone oxidoreductase chain 2 n=1 Tax=Cucujoidea sp. 22 KM-2017 TaxID=2219359 RepID=A0A346RI84_9CUCU|nr:NADH dehydrogenase subunit 2 [Cucujoidea sp. 22 KM-2017]